MPIYEFRCNSCGNAFEELVRSVGAAPDSCPSCDGADLTRQFSAFAVGKAAPASASPICEPGAACQTGGCATGACPF